MHIDMDFAVDMLMTVYPEGAVAEALKRADNLLKAGDPAAANRFTQIAAVIAQRQAAEPDRPASVAPSGGIAELSTEHG